VRRLCMRQLRRSQLRVRRVGQVLWHGYVVRDSFCLERTRAEYQQPSAQDQAMLLPM
jgi:hypothetical protein